MSAYQPTAETRAHFIGKQKTYMQDIADLDEILVHVRGLWMGARDPSEKRSLMERLNQRLDERINLMAARDAAGAMADLQVRKVAA